MPLNPLILNTETPFKKLRICVVSALCVAISGCAAVPDEGVDLPRQHMVSAANPHASRAGLEILRAGGSAVDAAIAVQAVLTLVEPQSSGIGGGAFLLHFRKSDGRVDAYDGRETAPAGIRPDVFVKPDGTRRAFRDAASGGQAVGVPGVIQALALAHASDGKLPWSRLFEPAIRLAEAGFAVSPRLHAMIARAPALRDFPAARAYFLTPDGEPLPVGYRLRNPALAETYRQIAARGAAGFYRGEIAAGIVAAVRTATPNPGTMTGEDLAGYAARKRDVLCRPYRTWRVCGMPPPTSGGIAVLQILGVLEQFDMKKYAPGSPVAIHLFAEAARLAYADRGRYVGDSDFVSVPVEGLLDRGYLARRASLISLDTALEKAPAGTPPGVQAADFGDSATAAYDSTSHLSVIDSAGNAVSMTTSVERPFGSYLMTGGFLLNSQLTDFAFLPRRDGRTVANAVAPGKRPRSSMSPSLVLDMNGGLVATVGSPGGSRIIAFVAKALVGLMDWNLDMQAAIDLPNTTLRRGRLELEKGTFAAESAAALRARGHDIRISTLTSGLHGIRVTQDGYDGGADLRREGIALGD